MAKNVKFKWAKIVLASAKGGKFLVRLNLGIPSPPVPINNDRSLNSLDFVSFLFFSVLLGIGNYGLRGSAN